MNGTGSAPSEGPLLDQGFDAATLSQLREQVAVFAAAAGVAKSRVPDIILVVHELAANAVRHGAGAGRLLMRAVGGVLSCQISDTAPVRETWPLRQGHGLWIAREVADQFTMSCGPAGSQVTAVFRQPRESAG